MCNLYSYTKPQDAARKLARVARDITGNMPPLPAIFPNSRAPIIRYAADGLREMTMARRGFPPPIIPGTKPRSPYLTNVRKTDSRFWKPFLRQANGCLVPATSFAEPWDVLRCPRTAAQRG